MIAVAHIPYLDVARVEWTGAPISKLWRHFYHFRSSITGSTLRYACESQSLPHIKAPSAPLPGLCFR